jgi:hypothetical protein
MPSAPDWQQVEERLFEESKAAILQFAVAHPDEVYAIFTYYSEPYCGCFTLFIDTLAHSLQVARYHEQNAIRRRKQMLNHEQMWTSAKYFSTQPPVRYHTPSVGSFATPFFASVQFEGWQEFADSDDYPKAEAWQDDYLEGNTRIVIWKVLERLIESGVFEQLLLASPFYLGYELHDEELVILRILHWP